MTSAAFVGDEEDAEFFYNEEEVLAGAGGDARAAMLDHYDSLLQLPSADDLDEVQPIATCVKSHLAICVGWDRDVRRGCSLV